jgi:superfamily II DNA/RNA helicase
MGFQAEMQKLIKSLPGLERRILLSATNAEQIPGFVNMSRKGTLINFLPDEGEQTAERITLYEVHSPQKDKLETLKQLLLGFGDTSTIVFLNYRDSVERVNDYLVEQGFTTSCFHGGLDQKEREAQLYRFSNGSANVLVSTDLASRGLDIPDIENIVHYHLPESEEGYIHRVGRTARWDAKGRSFFILNSEEHIPDYVKGNVTTYTDTPQKTSPTAPRMTTIYIGKGKKDKISKGDIVGFLCKTGGLTSDDIGRIDVKDRYAYAAIRRQTLQQVLRQTRGEKIKGIKTIIEEVK